MKKVAVLLADGFEEIEALTAVDLLRRARVYVDTVSITDDSMVRGSHGIKVQTEDLFEEVDFTEFEMIVLPGGLPGTTNMNDHPGVQKVVREFVETGKYVGAICAAPSILGGMGLLKGKHAISYPSFEEKLTGAIVTKNAVVQDGNIITSRGMGTSIDFALKLVEVMAGPEKASEIGDSILYFK